MKSYVRELVGGKHGDREIYVSVAMESGACDVHAMLNTAANLMREFGGRLIRERIFAPVGTLGQSQISANEFFHGVRARSLLHAGGNGAAGGVQLHGVISGAELVPLLDEEHVSRGVTFAIGDTRWGITSGITCQGVNGSAQALNCFQSTERLLDQARFSLCDLARTWIYMDDILSWYGPFNSVRNVFFIERSLMRKGERPGELQVPASTGMGVKPGLPGKIAVEAVAVSGDSANLRKFAASGAQRSAFEYGSAFARAAECSFPASRVVFVSGTAAIDSAGTTCHVGDAAGQMRMTIDNVMRVLQSTQCGPSDVVEAIAYCKTSEIASQFCRTWREEIPWPWVVVIGDVCRADLLFEAEVTAAQASGQ